MSGEKLHDYDEKVALWSKRRNEWGKRVSGILSEELDESVRIQKMRALNSQYATLLLDEHMDTRDLLNTKVCVASNAEQDVVVRTGVGGLRRGDAHIRPMRPVALRTCDIAKDILCTSRSKAQL